MKRIVITIVAAIITVAVAVALMSYLMGLKPEREIKEDVKPPIYVKTTQVNYDKIKSVVSSYGRVAPVNEVVITAEASGKIERSTINLKTGASFRKGAALFTIYDDEAKLALKASKSQFMSTLSQILPDMRIDYPNNFDKFNQFFKDVKLDDPLPELPTINGTEAAGLKVFIASRNILTDYYNIKQSELALSRYTVYAPFNGTIKEAYLEVGAYANMGTQVGKIIRTDLLEVEIPVELRYAKWIEIGDNVDLFTQDGKMVTTGHVVRASKFIESTTQQQSIFVQIEGSNSGLLMGEYLSATFQGHDVDGVIEVPRVSIFNGNKMYVVQNDKLAEITVNIVKLDDKTALVNGIEKGSDLVIQPLANVKETTVVEQIKQ